MELIFEEKRAKVYDDFISKWMPGYARYMEMLPYILKSSSSATENILVVGCGSGNELLSLNKKFPKSFITGIDPSAAMVKIAENKLEGLANIKVIKGTVEAIDTVHTFDAATLSLVLHFIPDDGRKLQLLKEIASKLTPKSVFILCDVFGSVKEIEVNLQILKNLLAPITNDFLELENRIEHIRNSFHYVDQDRLEVLFFEAGFTMPISFFKSSVYSAWLAFKK